MEVFSVTIDSIASLSSNLPKKNPFPSPKLPTESIPSHSLKKLKTNSSITSVTEVEEIFTWLQIKVETVILIVGETKLDSSSKAVSEHQKISLM
jgi:hypothetical protein